MTVRELKKLLKGLDNDMIVFMPVGDEALVTVCFEQSEVCGLDVPGKDHQEILLLMPCTCNHDEMPIDLEIHPN